MGGAVPARLGEPGVRVQLCHPVPVERHLLPAGGPAGGLCTGADVRPHGAGLPLPRRERGAGGGALRPGGGRGGAGGCVPLLLRHTGAEAAAGAGQTGALPAGAGPGRLGLPVPDGPAGPCREESSRPSATTSTASRTGSRTGRRRRSPWTTWRSARRWIWSGTASTARARRRPGAGGTDPAGRAPRPVPGLRPLREAGPVRPAAPGGGDGGGLHHRQPDQPGDRGRPL